MSHPPTNGAIAAAIPDRPDHAPTARRRSTRREQGLNDREAAWREQRASDALERAGGHQCLGSGRDAAEQRRAREPHDSEQENPPTPESVTQGTAEKDQRASVSV